MVGGWGWAMDKDVSNKTLVASFMEALDNTSNQILINEPGQALAGGLPTAKNAVDNPNFAKLMPHDPALDTFYTNILKYGSYRPPVAAYPKVSDVLQTVMGDIVSAHYSVSKAASTYNSQLQTAVGSSNTMDFSISHYSLNNMNNVHDTQSNYMAYLYNNNSMFLFDSIFW
jgi:multiple sugar transport system substrate-binding protein